MVRQRRRQAGRRVDTTTDNAVSSTSETPSSPTASVDPHNQGDAFLADVPKAKKWHSFYVRTIPSLIMLATFSLIIYTGPLAICCLVIVIQTLMFKEIIVLGNRERKAPQLRYLQWYIYISTLIVIYGNQARKRLKHTSFLRRHGLWWLRWLSRHFTFFSYTLLCTGFVLFVVSLRKKMYRYQFGQLAWTIVGLLLVVVQSSFIVSNIFEGIIWFVFPTSLIIVNDIMSYISGFFFGRTPLIKVSPKKTWEGFIGGAISTLFFAFFVSRFLSQFQHMICPRPYIDASPTTPCDPPDIFIPATYNLPMMIVEALERIGIHKTAVTIAPFQWHALAIGVFASMIAPFGGFFASGVKRAFKIKDFGDSIPGHGGLTDRMDCQTVMGFFAYIYVQNFARTRIAVDNVMSLVARFVRLPQVAKLEAFFRMRDLLVASGLLSNATAAAM